jgi:hypothetical protein
MNYAVYHLWATLEELGDQKWPEGIFWIGDADSEISGTFH